MHISSTRGHGVQVANHLLLAIVTAALAACGGGGGSTAADNAGTGSSMTASSATTSSTGSTGAGGAAASSAGTAALPTGSAVTAQAAVGPTVVRVNHDTAGQQTLAEMALQGGGYGVAWVSRPDSGTASVHLQRFDVDGRASGAELVLAVAGDETDPSVAVLPDGGLAIATLKTGSAAAVTSTAVVLRRYDASGTQLGTALQVASIDQDRTAGGPLRYVAAPRLIHWDDGTFMLAWSQVQDDANGKVPQFWARRFDAAGQPAGLNVLIGIGVAGSDLQMVATEKGGFVIATALSTQGGIYLMYRGFDGAFSPVLPADALGAAEGSRLLPLKGGAQVLFSPVKNAVAMQLYDARGQAKGAGMALHAMPVGMTALSDGGFELVTAGDAGTLQAQHYDAAGNPVGSAQAIVGGTTAAQGVALGNGTVALAWTANNAGDQDVMATRITP